MDQIATGTYWNWDRIIQCFILVLLILTVLLICYTITPKTNESLTDSSTKRILYLPALPIHFIYENPECTNKLLEALNITNVKIGNKLE